MNLAGVFVIVKLYPFIDYNFGFISAAPSMQRNTLIFERASEPLDEHDFHEAALAIH